MKNFTLKLTAAIAIAGVLRTPKDKQNGLVDADESLAKNLLHRGKARLATAEDLAAAGRDVPPDGSEDTDTGPTREQLDAALAGLPGTYKDADYVVANMRSHWGDVFTSEDEASVRELVKPAAIAKPSDGLNVKQLRKALNDKGVDFKADADRDTLAKLLDAQPAA